MGKPKHKSSRKENLDKYAERQRRMSRSGLYLTEAHHGADGGSTLFGAMPPITSVGVADHDSPVVSNVTGIASSIVVGAEPVVVELRTAQRRPKPKPPQMTFRELVEELNKRHPLDEAA